MVWTSLASLSLPISALVTGPVIARALGPENRGALAAIAAPVALLAAIGSVGVIEALIYFTARGQLSRLRGLGFSFGAGALMGAVAAALLAFSAPQILAAYPEHIKTLQTVALALPVLVALANLRGVAQGVGAYKLVNTERAVSVLLRLAGLVVLAIASALTVITGTAVVFGSTVVAGLLLLLVLRRPESSGQPRPASSSVLPSPLEPKVKDTAAVRLFVRYAARTSESNVAMTLINRLDIPLLAMVLPPAQLGYYAVAIAVAEIPAVGFGATNYLLLARSTGGSQSGELNARGARAVGLVVGLIAAFGIVAAPLVIPLAFGSKFAGSVVPAQILLVSAIFQVVMQQHGTGLVALGAPRRRTLACIPALLVYVPVVFGMATIGGVVGAAAGVLLIRMLASGTMAMIFARRSGHSFRAVSIPTRQEFADVKALVVTVAQRFRLVRRD